MGLDIYAGTLTRYYAQNWKTVTQQWAEANGYNFHRVAPEENEQPEDERMSPEEIQNVVENWRDQILAKLVRLGHEPYVPWTEDNEKPYFTDKPDWDAFGAMLLVAACCSYKEPVPATIPKNWNFVEHSLIKRLSEDTEKVWSLFRETTWWIPLPDGFLFPGILPNGCETMIAATAGLRRELEALNDLAWQADEETILGRSQTEGYPVDGDVNSYGIVEMKVEHTQYDVQSLAKYAFSIFYRALKFAEENQVPILLDY